MTARVNTKFVVILFAGIVLLVAGVFGLWFLVARNDPQQLMMRGEEFAEVGNWNRAVEKYGKALSKRRDDPELILRYADAVSRMETSSAIDGRKYIEQMMIWWGKAAELQPDDPRPVEGLMGLYMALGRDLGDSSAWDRMLERSQLLLSVKPDLLVARKYRGIAQANRMRFTDVADKDRFQAREDLLAVLASDPDDAEAIYHLAMWNLMEAKRVSTGVLGDQKLARQLREEAVSRLTESSARHPDDMRRKLDLITILLDPSVADADRARPLVAQVEAQLLENPAPATRVLIVADLLNRLDREPSDPGDPDSPTGGVLRATRLLQRAVEVRPEDLRYQVAYGRSLAVQQKIEPAIEVLDRARAIKGKGSALEALRSAELRLAANLLYGDLLLQKLATTTQQEDREALIDKVDQVVRTARSETSADNPSVNLLAGKLDLARGDVGNALKRFNAASTQFGEKNPEALLLAARAAMQLREWGAAANNLQRLIELRPDLESARLELARLYLQMQDPQRARAQIQQVLADHPDSRDAQLMLASMNAQSGEVGKSIESLRAMGAERDPRLSMELARLLMLQGAEQSKREALSIITARFEENPADLNVLQTLIRLTGEQQAALALVERSRQAGGDERALALLEAQLRGEAIDLEALVEEEIDKIDDPIRRHLVRYGLYRRMGQTAKAMEQLDAVEKLDPDNATIIASRFDLALEEKDWPAAEKLASRAAKLSLDLAEGLFYYGRLELARGRVDEAINSFRRGLMLRQTFSEGHRLLGDALRAKGDYLGAVESYRVALDQKPDNIAAIRGQAIAYDALRDVDNALAAMRRAVQFAPNDRVLLDQYLNYELTHGDPAQVLKVRQQLAATNPGDTDNRRAYGLLLADQGHHAEAKKVIDSLVEQEGLTRANVAASAGVKRAANDVQGAVDLLESYVRSRGDQADMDDYLLVGRFFMSVGGYDRALAAYRLAIEKEDSQAMPATRELADLMFDRGVGDEAVRLYGQLYEANPDDARVALRYAETLLRLNRGDEAQKIVQAAAQKHGETVESLLLRSLILLQKGDRAEAVATLDKAIEKDPNRAMVYFQRAQARAGDARAERQVMTDLDKAIELDPKLISARLLRAELKRDRGDTTGAIMELRNVLQSNPQFVAARMQLVDLFLGENRMSELANLLDESERLFPNEATWPRIRAQIAERQRKPGEATAAYARAFELQPTPPNLGNLTLSMLAEGKARQALELLDRHAEMVAAVPTLLAVRGRAQHGANQSDAGIESFRLALSRCENFVQYASVARQVRLTMPASQTIALLEASPDSVPQAWVGLAAAQVLMDEQRWDEALSRLRQVEPAIPQEGPEYLSLLQMEALALYQTRAYDQAKVVYEKLNEAQPSNVGTLNNLAYLLVENLGQPDQGLALAERAARLAPDNAQVLDTLGWAQFKTGQTDRAIQTLRRSVRAQDLAPNWYHLGVALAKAGNRGEARSALNKARGLAEQAQDAEILELADRALRELDPET